MTKETLEEMKRPADASGNGEGTKTLPETPAQKKEPSGEAASKRPQDKKVELDGDDNAKIGNVGTKTKVDQDGQADSTLAPEKSAKTVSKVMEAFAENTPKFTLSEELGSLLESEDLSEDFRSKAVTIFESAINMVLEAEHEKMIEAFGETLSEALELQEAEIEDRVQRYVDYVASEWVNENKLEIEHGIRNEINESIVSDIVDILEKHNIKLDESQIDVVEEERVARERAETALEEAVDYNAEIKERLAESQKLLALVNFSRENSLTMVEEDKLYDLAKDTVFENAAQFTEKLNTLKENYFTSATKPSTSLTEDINGDVKSAELIAEETKAPIKESPNARYLNTYRKMSKGN